MPLFARVVALGCLLASSAFAAPSSAFAGVHAPGDQLCASRFDGPHSNNDMNPAIAMSPDGSEVFVAGTTIGIGGGAVIAYDAASGTELWVSVFDDSPAAVTVSPDGSRLYVTGGDRGYRTTGYDTVTGGQLWTGSFAIGCCGTATSLALSPDGLRLFVTGIIVNPGYADDYATIAYNAISGAHVWVRLYDGPATEGNDDARAIDVSPNGKLVFVTGTSYGAAGISDPDIATIAYDATTGSRRWLRRFDGPGETDSDGASSLTASEDGSRVFVTGQTSPPDGSGTAYITLAYSAVTGTPLWARSYDGPAVGRDTDDARAIAEHGGTVYVTGGVEDEESVSDYVTIAYEAVSGKALWLARYAGPGASSNVALDIAIRPDGAEVFATGYSAGSSTSFDYATVAYDATSGRQHWVTTYDGPGSQEDEPTSLLVSPDGTAVFVAGDSMGLETALDFATVAYST
jgi:hypothetical protein